MDLLYPQPGVHLEVAHSVQLHGARPQADGHVESVVSVVLGNRFENVFFFVMFCLCSAQDFGWDKTKT